MTHSVMTIECAKQERLVLSFNEHIDHAAHFRWNDVVRTGSPSIAFPFPLLETCQSIAGTGFDHVTGHQLESLLKMVSKDLVWPEEIVNEILQGVELPE